MSTQMTKYPIQVNFEVSNQFLVSFATKSKSLLKLFDFVYKLKKFAVLTTETFVLIYAGNWHSKSKQSFSVVSCQSRLLCSALCSLPSKFIIRKRLNIRNSILAIEKKRSFKRSEKGHRQF